MAIENSVILNERNFKVSYDRISENLWRASAELFDDIHQIKTWMEIQTPEFIVKNAGINFLKMPLDECEAVNLLAKKLIGVKVKDLGFKVFRTFLGSDGCANVYLLFGLSGPAFINVYYLNLVSEGKMTQTEYNKITKKDCLAHKLNSKVHQPDIAH